MWREETDVGDRYLDEWELGASAGCEIFSNADLKPQRERVLNVVSYERGESCERVLQTLARTHAHLRPLSWQKKGDRSRSFQRGREEKGLGEDAFMRCHAMDTKPDLPNHRHIDDEDASRASPPSTYLSDPACPIRVETSQLS